MNDIRTERYKRIEKLQPGTINHTGHFENCLMCPFCRGWEGLHVTRVNVKTGKSTTSVTSGGTFVDNRKHPDVHRGSITTIQLYCELCDHITEIDFKFHKGEIYIDCYDIGLDVIIPYRHNDIWRD